MKRTVLVLAILLMTLAMSCGQGETSTTVQAEAAAKTAPVAPETKTVEAKPETTAEELLTERLLGYSAETLDGSTYRIADKRGKVLLINAWATWCGPCRYEIPELKRLHEQYGADGLEIVGVSVDMKPAEPAVRQFVDVNQIEYPILLDPQSRLTTALRTTSIPTSVMIDREGQIVWRHIGIVSEQRDESFREALSAALGG